jgi:hypothetical protein
MNFYIKLNSPQELLHLGDVMLEHPEVATEQDLPDTYAVVKVIYENEIGAFEKYIRSEGFEDGPRFIDNKWILKFKPQPIPEEEKFRILLRIEQDKRDAVEQERLKLRNINYIAGGV